MSQRPQITFIEEFYYPEGWGGAQIPQDITVELSRSGFEVTVICSERQYLPVEGDAPTDPRAAGVRIRYVPESRFSKRSRKGALTQLVFCLAGMKRIGFSPRPALFICQTNPPLMIVALACLSAVMRRPLMIIAQDIYPEVMIAHGMLRKRTLQCALLEFIFRWAYRRAARVISLGPKMTERLRTKGVSASKIREISNWATGDLSVVRGSANVLLREWNLTGSFVLLYSGNLGVAHDSITVLHAVVAAKRRLPELRLIFIGQGTRLDEVKQMSESLGIADCVQCRAPVNLSLLPQALGIADLALVTLLPGFEGLVVPSKLLGHMARGIPTLYVGPRDGDVAQTIAESFGGIVVGNGDAGYLADRLVELASDREQLRRMGQCAARFYAENLTREIGLGSYDSVVNDLVRERRLS